MNSLLLYIKRSVGLILLWAAHPVAFLPLSPFFQLPCYIITLLIHLNGSSEYHFQVEMPKRKVEFNSQKPIVCMFDLR